MAASHALRLQSMLRSMTEVIIPAIDKNAQLAVDQANIMVGNIRILLDQQDKAYQYRMVELRHYVQLVEDLMAIADGGPATAAQRSEAAAVLAIVGATATLAIPTQAKLTAQVIAIKTVADSLTRAAYIDGDPAFRTGTHRLIVEAGGKEILRERVWVRKGNFESEPYALPSIEALLALD